MPAFPSPGPLSDCSGAQSRADVRSIMVPTDEGLAFGISLAKHDFKVGEHMKLQVWVDNRSDAPIGLFTCFGLDRFKISGIAVFAQRKHLVLTRTEQIAHDQCSLYPRVAVQWGFVACSSNLQMQIPPHTCATRDDHNFEYDLTDVYHLPPGRYLLRLRPHWERGLDVCSPNIYKRSHRHPHDLAFTVETP